MLDLLRKHASSWVIKVTLGAIILTFVLFFGYAGLQNFGLSEDKPAAMVNNIPIPESLYRFYTERNLESLKQSFSNQAVPDFAKKFAESNALRQLMFRTLALQEADRLGVFIPDAELADYIVNTQKTQQGSFDPIFYRHQYLPFFSQRYGFQYETVVRDDLRLALTQKLFEHAKLSLYSSEAYNSFQNEQWTFEMVELSVPTLLEKKLVTNESEVEAIAKLFLTQDKKQKWEDLIRHYQLTIKKIGPVSLTERHQIPTTFSFEDQQRLFALRKEKPLLEKPIVKEKTFCVARLVHREMKVPTKNIKSPATPDVDFFEQWISQKLATAEVRSFVDTK